MLFLNIGTIFAMLFIKVILIFNNMSIYLFISFIVALFSADDGKLSSTECILFGLCQPIILICYMFIYSILFIQVTVDSTVSYIKEYKYKMYINKQIIDLVKKFNDKIENEQEI